MNDIKLSLTVTLPGRVMFSEQECSKQLKKTIVDKKNHKKVIDVTVVDFAKTTEHSMVVESKVDGKKVKETIHFRTRKCKPITQVINMTSEAYNYMVSAECPYWEKPKDWKGYNKQKRLESHLHQTALTLGGQVKYYKVFED